MLRLKSGRMEPSNMRGMFHDVPLHVRCRGRVTAKPDCEGVKMMHR